MPGADSDITLTLSELKRKLEGLETELSAGAGQIGAPIAPPDPRPPLPTVPSEPAPDLDGTMAELERFRGTLEQSARLLIDEYRRLLEHVHTPAYGAPPVPPPAGDLPAPPAHGRPDLVAAPAPAEPTGSDPTVQGRLTIDAGPFGDIATLSQFEQALGRLPGAQDVYVKGFEGHRALVDLQLDAALPLATHLRQVLALEVTVHEPVPGSQQLRVDVEGTTGV